MKAPTPTYSDYILTQILRSSRNSEINSAEAAKASHKAVKQTRAKLGWIPAICIAVLLVVFAFPMARYFEVPYVGVGLDKFTSWSRYAGRDAGILLAEKVIYRQSKQTRLNGIHPDLISVYHLANEYAHLDGMHIHIREGLRDPKRQAQLFKAGFSATMNSRHLDGHALDLGYQYEGPQSNNKDWKYARIIDKHMQRAAKDLGIRVEWGGNWKSFPDGFHWQLPWKTYKKTLSRKAHKKKIVIRKPKQTTLTKANTDTLLKGIIQRESSNDHTEENQFGMLGLCQVTAATLVEIGLVSRSAFDKLDKKSKAGRGQQKAFLNNPDNWTLKGGKQKFMSSRDIQMKACREVLKLHTHYGKSSGALDGNSSQRRIAGYLFAAQFGHVRANDYYLRGVDSRDGNRVLTSTYAKLGESLIGK